MTRLRALDTATLRSAYAASLILWDDMLPKLQQPGAVSEWPVYTASLAIRHYEQDIKAIPAREIIDASQALPAGGMTIVTSKDDPTVDGNPELSALLRELKLLNDSL